MKHLTDGSRKLIGTLGNAIVLSAIKPRDAYANGNTLTETLDITPDDKIFDGKIAATLETNLILNTTRIIIEAELQ